MNLWHYIAAVALLTLLGAVFHASRSSFNFVPDRLNPGRGLFWKEHIVDDMLSSNYGFWDMVAGTEYDEEGFYAFFSVKNLRISCTWTIASGMALLLSYDDLQQSFVDVVDRAPGWLWELFIYRLQNIRLI